MASSPSAPPRPHLPLRGIAMRCAMMVAFALMSVMVKLAAGRGVGTVEILFYRNLFALPVVLAWLLAGPGLASVRTAQPRAHLSRAVIGLGAMMLSFQALRTLPLAEATTIGFTAPLFSTILSALILKEPIGPRRWAAVAVGFVGVLVIVRPGNLYLPPDGLAIALAAAMGASVVTVTIRQIGATEAAATTVFWFTLAGTIVGALLMPLFAARHDAITWLYLLLIGLLGGSAQLLMTASLRIAPISVLAPFDYSQLIWALGLAWLVWGTQPSSTTIAGGALIAASGIYTAWREHRRRMFPPVSPAPIE